MKMKVAVVASSLLVSVQTASAQFYNRYYDPNANFYYQYENSPAAENDLADAKALRDKARKEREETGKSDVDARLRLRRASRSASRTSLIRSIIQPFHLAPDERPSGHAISRSKSWIEFDRTIE